ncbi:uncharacterized protein METZ01_LOCUS208115, partial [marine metagenome]
RLNRKRSRRDLAPNYAFTIVIVENGLALLVGFFYVIMRADRQLIFSECTA